MRLYHFTNLHCLLGEEGFKRAKEIANGEIDVVGLADDTSILRRGILPGDNDRGDPEDRSLWHDVIGLPDCVWLTSNPSPGPGRSTYYEFRIEVDLALNSSRLRHFRTWISDHVPAETFARVMMAAATAGGMDDWYVYFGVVIPPRFLSVTATPEFTAGTHKQGHVVP